MSDFFQRIAIFFRPHRTIPKMPWTADNRWQLSFKRLAILVSGLSVFGLGDSLLVQSKIGNAPWTVLAQGLSLKSGFNIGFITFIIGFTVLLLWIPLRIKPGFGTIANIVVISAAIQFGITHVPESNNFLIGVIYCFIGVGLVGIGSAFYITCGLGPGPRDGLMTGLHNKFGVRISRTRLAIEITVLTIGAALGGRIGLGTAIFALFIGSSIAVAIGVVSRLTEQ